MKRSELNLKENDIVYIDDDRGLCIIHEITTKKEPIYKESNLFSLKKEKIGEEEVVDQIWFYPVHDKSGKITSFTMGSFMNWNEMKMNATLIINQCKLLIESKHPVIQVKKEENV